MQLLSFSPRISTERLVRGLLTRWRRKDPLPRQRLKSVMQLETHASPARKKNRASERKTCRHLVKHPVNNALRALRKRPALFLRSATVAQYPAAGNSTRCINYQRARSCALKGVKFSGHPKEFRERCRVFRFPVEFHSSNQRRARRNAWELAGQLP